MSIWCSWREIGWDHGTKPKMRHGMVRSYASGWSNHYPTTDGAVEQPASVGIASIPVWCVPGHADEMTDDLGPWLRLDSRRVGRARAGHPATTVRSGPGREGRARVDARSAGLAEKAQSSPREGNRMSNDPREAWAKFWQVAVVDPLTPFVRWLAARPEWQLWSFVAACWVMFTVFLVRAVAHA